jgi:hypothetical protein
MGHTISLTYKNGGAADDARRLQFLKRRAPDGRA